MKLAFALYLIPTILGHLAGFITLPFVTRYLTAADFGRIAMFNLAAIPFTIAQEWGTAVVLAAKWNESPSEGRRRLLFNLLAINVLTSLAGIVLVSCLPEKLFEAIVGQGWHELRELYPWLLVAVLSRSIGGTVAQWIVLTTRARLYATLESSRTVAAATLMIYLAATTRDYKAIIVGEACLTAGFALVQGGLIARQVTWGFDAAIIRETFSMGFPLFLRSFFNQTRSRADKIVLARFVSLESFGLYDFAQKLWRGYAALSDSFERAYVPQVMKSLAKNLSIPRQVKRWWSAYYGAIFVGSCLYLAFGQEAISFLTNGVFVASYPLGLVVCCMALVAASFSGNPNVIVHAKMTRLMLISSIASAVVTIAVSMILAPTHGALGAMFGLGLGVVTAQLVCAIARRRVLKEPFVEHFIAPTAIFAAIAIARAINWRAS